MPDLFGTVDIPNRALFKASEVCELLRVQPYVLRSWEAEFPQLGIAKSAGAPRVYRRADVEQVQRIKHLLLVEGLTLAGARRKLEEESTPVGADSPLIDELIGQNARERLTEVKRGLRSILDLLAGRRSDLPLLMARDAVASGVSAGASRASTGHRVKNVRSKAQPARRSPTARRPAAPRRKRSA